jgi:hypothetical protein
MPFAAAASAFRVSSKFKGAADAPDTEKAKPAATTSPPKTFEIFTIVGPPRFLLKRPHVATGPLRVVTTIEGRADINAH